MLMLSNAKPLPLKPKRQALGKRLEGEEEGLLEVEGRDRGDHRRNLRKHRHPNQHSKTVLPSSNFNTSVWHVLLPLLKTGSGPSVRLAPPTLLLEQSSRSSLAPSAASERVRQLLLPEVKPNAPARADSARCPAWRAKDGRGRRT